MSVIDLPPAAQQLWKAGFSDSMNDRRSEYERLRREGNPHADAYRDGFNMLDEVTSETLRELGITARE